MGESWFNVSTVKGEFNPIVSTDRIYEHSRHIALWIDNDVWVAADVHHLPNKYINQGMNAYHEVNETSQDQMFEMFTREEQLYIFRACEKAGVKSILTETLNITLTGDDCTQCFQKDGKIKLSSTIYRHKHNIRSVKAHFKCKEI
jgi:hypothetical protein